MVAPAALLRCVGRVDFDERSASFFRFARELDKERRPRGICNAFGETVGMEHAVDMHVLNTDHAVRIDDRAAFLVGEVLPSPADTLVYSRDDLALLMSLECSLLCCGEAALRVRQGALFFPEEARIVNLTPIRKSGERLESHI